VSVLALAAAALAGAMVLLWLVSLLVRDASIVDPCWGLLFVLVAWLAFAVRAEAAPEPAALLLPALVTVWGLRLSGYLAWRAWGEDEDFRYRDMRARWPAFWLTSLGGVFLLQGALAWVIALPIQLQAPAPAPPLGWLDAAGPLVALAGVAWEATADAQLARFKADPANRGQVCDRGLWGLSRHPNYFGDFVFWWGLYLTALGRGAPWWTVVGPVVMSALLMKVSGVPLLESSIAERRPGYADYAARTNAFFPGPRRSAPAPAEREP